MNSPAFAWGNEGHRIICQIAYEELKSEIRARVDSLVAIDPKFRTFADVSIGFQNGLWYYSEELREISIAGDDCD